MLIIIFIVFSSFAIGQGTKIKWEDNDGREFSVSTHSGSLSYSMLEGDNVSYDYSGNVTKVGPVYISYDYNGHVTKVGSVYISYNTSGHVTKVGGLYINYDYNGRISSTTGSVIRNFIVNKRRKGY